ncbi:transcription-repair coupling factor [Patescibacteria group bacterium]|nr:transcription-repair coupling factor [Patescibacteria group bacterium]MBU1703466.1 transcription-repair coupling factor [Patescibacteria group bacterium]MBU1953452.1 transcription-repair coupling factor [Patescibacteria group bacterium]
MKTDSNLIEYFSTVQNGRALDALTQFKNISISGAGNYSAKAFTVADILREKKDIKAVMWVVNDVTTQDNTVKALQLWSGLDVFAYSKALVDPSRLKYSGRMNKIAAVELANYLGRGERKVAVLSYTDALDSFPDYKSIKERRIVLKKGESVDMNELFEKLIDLGYEVCGGNDPEKGEYHKSGEVLTIFPLCSDHPVRIDVGFDEIGSIHLYNAESGEDLKELSSVEIIPASFESAGADISSFFTKDMLVIEDELDLVDEFYENWNTIFDEVYGKVFSLAFVSFNEDEENHQHLHFISVLKYRGVYDLINDLRDKQRDEWRTVVLTKDKTELTNIFDENNFSFDVGLDWISRKHGVFLVEVDKESVLPQSFQNPELKLAFITDKETSSLREEKKKHFTQKAIFDFVTSLKPNDYVVHANHGIGRYLGLEKRTIDDVTREYLQIGYAENDKLFVPIDQADKVNKFIGADEQPPRLTRLGSVEWNTITRKVQKETEAIAKELLLLYAERKSAKGFRCKEDNQAQHLFDEAFPYEETPGQMKSIIDVKADMERIEPMDRLVCGDVGFGKTEVAMRAAFKAVQNGKQVAFISPITILADQHYRSFIKRMEGFDVRVDVLSRFRTQKEQKEILRKLVRGEVDVVIGTHRLLQPDVKFKDLGLVVVDEEQRFGVKQKEKFKDLKKEVHVLTLTATPIPRTLNFALNKLRDISTITTPPPGRLPIITEVRRYSHGLIRDAILRELSRGGQVYFLHNRVQTIDSVADKLRKLIPEARFCVAHGKLGSSDLEERIISFKDHKCDVLVSSTIIENGIDLANANTLIVNNAERLGLAQLYQLRGRVGRGKKQAYAYFLYHGQRLKLDAKKRLRAIVEASELGSGFQIAMKDLEIRGAGDILGAKQHGAINVVGVSHFIRMLNKAVDDLKAGKVIREEEPEEVSVELPLTAYIPDNYIVNSKEKINAYQKMSACDSMEYLTEIRDEILEDYGKMPAEVLNLFRMLELKILARKAKLVSVKTEDLGMNKGKEVVLHMSGLVKPENIISLLEHNSKWRITGTRLRITIAELGMHWFDELRDSVKRLSMSIREK